MSAPAEPKKGLLSGLIGDINTNVGVSSADLTKIGATLFVSACLIMLAYFTFRKYFNS